MLTCGLGLFRRSEWLRIGARTRAGLDQRRVARSLKLVAVSNHCRGAEHDKKRERPH
jgi:hypothetical protein